MEHEKEWRLLREIFKEFQNNNQSFIEKLFDLGCVCYMRTTQENQEKILKRIQPYLCRKQKNIPSTMIN